MRAFAVLLLLANLPGQETATVHHAHPRLEPWRAFQHLGDGHRQRLRAGLQACLDPGTRPAGAGRWLAAVVSCADMDADPAHLFVQRPRDLLRLRSPGPGLSSEDVALLEHAVRHERLSLCLLLTHADCQSLHAAGADATDAAKRLARATAAARKRAELDGIPIGQAQALLLKEALLAGSELLRERAAASRFAVVPGVVDPRTGHVRWILPAAERLPMPPVRVR